MTQPFVPMASLELQDAAHQLVQQFIAELHDMLQDVAQGELSDLQKKVLHKIVSFFDQEMKEHHLDEERRIFPLLLSRGDAQLSKKVERLKADHDELRESWLELKQWITQTSVPAAMDVVRLQASFERYSVCFARHLALEESLQFSPDIQALFQRWDMQA